LKFPETNTRDLINVSITILRKNQNICFLLLLILIKTFEIGRIIKKDASLESFLLGCILSEEWLVCTYTRPKKPLTM
jgi:hypothetical protein